MNNDINNNQGNTPQTTNPGVVSTPQVQPQPVAQSAPASNVQPQVQPQPVQQQPVASVTPVNNVSTGNPKPTGVVQPNTQVVNNQAPTQSTSSNTPQINVSNRKLDTNKIVELIKKNKLIVIGVLVLIVVFAIFSKGGKSGGVLKKNTSNNTNITNNEKTEEQKRLEEEALKGTFVIGLYRLKYPEGYSLKDTIDGTIILTDEQEHRIELTLEKYQTAYKKSNAIQAEIADVYALDGYETRNCGMRKIEQTPWAVYDGYRDEMYKTIGFVEFQSKMLKIQLENDSLEYNTKILEEFNELIKHVIKK